MTTPIEGNPSIKYPVTLQGTPWQGYYLEVPASAHQDFLTTHIGEPLTLTLKGTRGSAALVVEVAEEPTKTTAKTTTKKRRKVKDNS